MGTDSAKTMLRKDAVDLMKGLRSDRTDVILRALEVLRENGRKRFGLKRRLKKLCGHESDQVAYRAGIVLGEMYPRAAAAGVPAVVAHEQRFGTSEAPGAAARMMVHNHVSAFLRELEGLKPVNARRFEYWRRQIHDSGREGMRFLMSLMKRGDDETARFALRALGDFEAAASSASGAIRDALPGFSESTAVQAHLTLARIDPAHASEGALKILEFVRSPDRRARVKAVRALTGVHRHLEEIVPGVGRLLDHDAADGEIIAAVEEYFGKLGPPALEHIVRTGVGKTWGQRAAELIAAPDLIPVILSEGGSASEEAAEFLAVVLARVLRRHPRELPGLLNADGGGLIVVLRALVLLEGEMKQDVMERLFKIVDAGGRSIAPWAVLSLRGCANEATTDRFVPLLEHPLDQVRENACLVLEEGKRKARKAVPTLVALLKDHSVDVRSAAARALAAISPEADAYFPDLMAAFNRPREKDPARLEMEFAGHLAGKLADGDPRVVEKTLIKVADLGHRGLSLLPQISICLRNRDLWVRARSLELIRRYGNLARELLPDLLSMLEDPDWYVRQLVMQCLPLLAQDESIVAALRTALDDESDDVRKEAVRALGTLGPAASSAAPRLVSVQSTADDAMGREINKALLRINATAAAVKSSEGFV